MKLTNLSCLFFQSFFALLLTFSPALYAAHSHKASATESYTQVWNAVDSLSSNGLTQSAHDTAVGIYKRAKAADNADQIIKALVYDIKLSSFKEEDAFVKTLSRLNMEISAAKFPVAQVLHSMLAECYWHYYQNNRWRFYNRTQTQNFDLKDIHTWDLRTIMEKMTQEYELSLKDADTLKKTPVKIYNEIIDNRSTGDSLRPTLYDFLSHRAIDFFFFDDNELTRPAFEFTLSSPDYFVSFDKFAHLDITTKDTASLKFHALKLLRDLIAFHEHDATPDALIDVDLKRLSFVRTHAVLGNKDSLYLLALSELEKRFAKYSASTEATFAIARLKSEWAGTFKAGENEKYRWLNREAIDICNKAITAYPGSYGANECKSLISGITTKQMGFTTESVSMPDKPFKTLFTFKNVKRVYWRQIKIGFDEYESLVNRTYGDSVVIKLAKYKPIKEWSTALPDAGDYQSHSVELQIPPLPSGHYVILCASDTTFTYRNNAAAYSSVQMSHLSVIDRHNTEGSQEFYIVDRQTGAPLQNVTVTAWQNVYDNKSRMYKKVLYKAYQSDQEGHVLVSINNSRRSYEYFTIDCKKDNDCLFSTRQFYLYQNEREKPRMALRTFFFTDRAIYRPGQTIYFKGILLRTDGEKSDIATGENTTVRFVNTNNQDVATLNLTTNQYGSINGSFVAPVNSLNGEMTIQDGYGSVGFSVEDYKRPKFEVTLDPVTGTSHLGDTIKVTGLAKAYAGSAIDGAKIKYRVVRTARFPNYWWFYWRPVHSSNEMEISNGSAVTNDTGGFAIQFPAIADLAISPSEKPVFSYRVIVDITDMNGETRSGETTVDVGYDLLKLTVTVGQLVKQDSVLKLPVSTTNTNGTFEPAQGNIVVYKLNTPEKVYRNRLWAKPDTTVMTKSQYSELFPEDIYDSENDMTKWNKADKVFEGNFDTKTLKTVSIANFGKWKPGVYVLEAKTKDKAGQEVKDIRYFTLYTETGSAIPLAQTDWFVPVKDQCEPGEKAVFLVGSGYKDVKMLYEIEHKNEIVKKEWISINSEQKRLEIPIEEKHRGNLSIHITFVHSSRNYQHTGHISVPWTNKNLDISFETFRNKLLPGEKEEWRMKIAGKDKDKVAAEMVATLYDASLDAFMPHGWDFSIYPGYWGNRQWNMIYNSQIETARVHDGGWNSYNGFPGRYYPQFNWFGYDFEGSYYGAGYGGHYRGSVKCRSMDYEEAMPCSAPAPASEKEEDRSSELKSKKASAGNVDDLIGGLVDDKSVLNNISHKASESNQKAPKPDLSQIATRTNLNETAFFYPALETNENGEIIVKFTIPEALTKWKMLGFAHTKDLKFGSISNELITQKSLMVMPNPPRFFRENDSMTFSAKVSNLSDSNLTGNAQLFLFDAATNKPVDAQFKNINPQIAFTVAKGQSAALAWDIVVPEGIGAVSFKVIAKAKNFSDGEEQIIPVLTNSMLVTESVPLPIRKKETKKFSLPTLVSQNNGSTTLRNHKLTLEFSSNPAWYAIQSLPYLMEYPYECAEQTFSRFYANTIASHIANSSPRIKAVFDQWKSQSPDALLSNLEKNQELKALALEETPWLCDGKDESERKKRVALLFDMNKMADEKDRAFTKLKKLQLDNGGWPWFEGGPDDRYITQYIAIGLARLGHLGMIDLRKDNELGDMTTRFLGYLDNRIREDYEWIMAHGHPGDDNLGETQIQYLFMRSYFKDIAVDKINKPAFEYFLNQSKLFWLQKRRYMQGMIALALNRYADKNIPAKIVRSLKENSLVSEEMGMYWKEMYENCGWWWYEAPIESQALMVEVFDEVAHDTASVEDLKAWLLKSKQTQNWQTTKATTEACYALLLRGTNWLEKPSTVSITLGSVVVDAAHVKDAKVEAGTGYFKTSWSGSDIKPDMGNITVSKQEAGVAWGAVYWQYFEQLDKIKKHETPLSIIKKLFVEQASATGPKIFPIDKSTILKTGDKITVRIELRVDRDMEYVHMKDMRAAGFEPLNVFSGYKWQDGLGYYESTRDAATNFFFSYLQKGTYVFEYPLVVSHAGEFSNGVTTIQCMYAPEFGSHSEGVRVKVAK